MAKNRELRFTMIHYESALSLPYSTTIYVDQKTGIQYLLFCMGVNITVTPLLGRDGKPLLYEPPDEIDSE